MFVPRTNVAVNCIQPLKFGEAEWSGIPRPSSDDAWFHAMLPLKLVQHVTRKRTGIRRDQLEVS
jgi:hypothetical protein